MKEFHYSRRQDPESTLKKYEFRFVNKEGNIRDILIVIDVIPKTKKSVASLLDITERKQAEEKYRYLFDNAQVGLYWSRISNGKILECNDTFVKLFGYVTREECLADYITLEHYIDPNARSKILEAIRDNIEVKNYEIHVTKRDGTPIWLNISARVFEKEDRIEGAAIDITERKIAEEKLQLERDNFLNILNSMEDGVYIVDQNYDIEYVNPSLIKDFGDFNGIKCFKYFHDLNETCPWCKNKEVFQGKTVRWEWYSPKNQKTYDLIETPLINPDGSLSKLEIFRDISEIKKVEQELKESEEKYRTIFENTGTATIIVEEDTTISLVNGHLKNFLVIQKKRSNGKKVGQSLLSRKIWKG